VSAFETQLKVRFGHVDPAGIVYFPRIYDYLHDVFEELWEVWVGERYYTMVQERRIGMPLVHSEVDFTSPLHFGDRPLVRVTCFRLGRSSIGLRYRVRRADTECVDARMVTTCVDLETMDPIEIPADYRGAFERIREPLPDPA